MGKSQSGRINTRGHDKPSPYISGALPNNTIQWKQFLFWSREAWDNVRRNRLMSLLAISTVTIALFILGAFFLSISNLRAAVGAQTRKLDLVVVLKTGISPARRDRVVKAARIPQVKQLDVITASQALQNYGAQIRNAGGRLAARQPAGRRIAHPTARSQRLFSGARVSGQAAGCGRRAGGWFRGRRAQKLLDINRGLSIGAAVALGVLGLAILLIIHNAIRLTLFARRREIRIMQLVGATNGFIRVPFLLEGLFYGAAGAALGRHCSGADLCRDAPQCLGNRARDFAAGARRHRGRVQRAFAGRRNALWHARSLAFLQQR